MAKNDNKATREKCNVMNDAWVEGAPSAKFNGIAQGTFQSEIEAAAADDAAIADRESEIKMMKDVRDDKYAALNEKRTKVGQGVVGDPDFGDNSPLYGAMGFVRKSEKKSGLTRKKKPTE